MCCNEGDPNCPAGNADQQITTDSYVGRYIRCKGDLCNVDVADFKGKHTGFIKIKCVFFYRCGNM